MSRKTIVLTPGTLINRIVPLLAAGPAGASDRSGLAVALIPAAGLLLIALAVASFARRRRRRSAVVARASGRGLSPGSAALLGRLLADEGPDAAEELLQQPESLVRRLAHAVRQARDDAAAARLAEEAGRLLTETRPAPPFPGAPAAFAPLRLHDPADPSAPSVLAWALSVDERSLVLASRADCAWPARRMLRVAPDGVPRPGESFDAQLLLRPVHPDFKWVLTHRLVDVVMDHRAVARVPCRLASMLLPDDSDAPRLRERLHRDEPVNDHDLATSESWVCRHEASVLDLSADGAHLSLRHAVKPRQRFHLLLRWPDDSIAALPLAEVVAVGAEPDGSVRAGVRFVTVRLRERVRLANFVQALQRARVAKPVA